MRKLLRSLKLLRKPRHNKSPVLQEHFFRMALAERGIWGGEIEVDHMNGINFHHSTGQVPIVFPEFLLTFTSCLSKDKTQDYFFQGMIYPGREWLSHYNETRESSYGRDPQTKYAIDQDYYGRMSCSRFGLAPVGDCPWSYRFFEAIMCDTIPILGDKDVDVFAHNFSFQRHSDIHSYNETLCKENMKVLQKKHTLKGLLGE